MDGARWRGWGRLGLGSALLAGLLALGARPAGSDGPAPPAADPGATAGEEPEDAAAAFRDQIDKAIAKGIAYLRAQQMPNGSWGDLGTHVKTYAGGDKVYQHPIGPTSMALYALLKCEVPLKDAAVQKGFAWLKKAGVSPRSSAYEVSAALLAVTATADPFKKSKDSRAQGARLRLTGEWRTWAADLQKSLIAHRAPRGWRYQVDAKDPGGTEDVSSTMLAVLALASADRCGLATDPAVYADAASYVLTLLEPDGPETERVVRPRPRKGAKPAAPPSGGYAPPRAPDAPPKDRARGFHYSVHPTTKDHDKVVTGARTACGVGALALARYALAEKAAPRKAAPDPKAVEQGIYDGLAWLATKWHPWDNPGVGHKNVYYLYCVERAMDLVGAERLGDQLWYLEMVRALLPRQDPKGFWDTKDAQVGDRNPVCDTAFALLFLRRSAAGAVVPLTGDDLGPLDGR